MSLITIDRKKCKKDGICVQVCPSKIIVQSDKEDYPVLFPDDEEFCINCGHCVAACPHGALQLKTMPMSTCPDIRYDLIPGAAEVRHLLTARRSIRVFKDRPVAHDVLEELIDTARYAPTGSNKQQVQWTVFENPAEVKRLASMVIDFMRMMLPLISDKTIVKKNQKKIEAWDQGKDGILRGAPHLMVAHSQADLPFAEADCVIALTYLELYAFSKGLGTCWAGYLTGTVNYHEPLWQALGLPEGHKCFGAVMIGYPKYKYKRVPVRNEATVTWRG